jgi:hypothetical protein
MRTTFALLALLGSVLSGGAADAGAQPGVTAPTVGDTYPQVLAKSGHPSSEMDAGSLRVLYYPGVSVKLRDGVVVSVTVAAGGGKGTAAAGPTAPAAGSASAFAFKEDAVEAEANDFGRVVLGRFEAEKFGDLEVLAAHIIAEKSLFGDGSWKIVWFHEALEPAPDVPEEKWAAREVKIEKWEQLFPDSITARTVHLGFLASYAWLARGPGSADSSKGVRAPLFNNRLAQAADLLQSCRAMAAKSPMLWFEGQRVALGQGWPAKDVLKGFEEAKRALPEFWPYDGQLARFLLPRWYGKEGDWEKFAESEIQREGGLGMEEYARTVYDVSGNYGNVFKESHAEWAFVKEGYGIMTQKYPASRRLLNQYALLCALAGDRTAAAAAFEAMKGEADPSVWRKRNMAELQEWAGRRP